MHALSCRLRLQMQVQVRCTRDIYFATDLKGIVNTTTLCALSTEDKAQIRRLLEVINLCLCTIQHS